MFSRRLTRSIATGAAAVTVATGAYAIGNSTTSSTSATSGAPTVVPAAQAAQTTQAGQVPPGWHSGAGTIITGAAADKAKAAAVATYPEGTVNRVLQLSDGSYAVHRIGTPAPHHIFVSKDFKVTGTA
jgi:hypothetical protein